MKIISHSLNDTINIGKSIAKNLKADDVICLFGDLGSGKTVLTKGIGQGLGIRSASINSPSFVLIRQYTQSRLPLYHFDLYRLKEPSDIMYLAYEEYLDAGGVVVIEWADRLRNLMPQEFLKIELSIRYDTQRLLEFSAFGRRYKELLRSLCDIARDLCNHSII